MKSFLACSSIGVLVLTAAACGGGGGGNEEGEGATPQILGPYQYFELVSGSTSFRFTEVGPAEVDATGLLTGDTQRYFDFLTSPEGLSPTRVLVGTPFGDLENRRENGELLRLGGLGAGGHLALLAAVDDLPDLVYLGRPDPNVTAADLEGAYHFTLFAPSAGASLWGRVTFDETGIGGPDTTPQVNENGALDTESLLTLGVSASPDGSLEAFVDSGNTPVFEFAGVVADGGRMLLASRTDDDQEGKPMLFAAVHASTNADASRLAGPYWFAAYLAVETTTPGEMQLTTIFATVDFDGAGGAVLNGTLNNGGSFQDLVNETGSYTVAADGALRLQFIEFSAAGGVDPTGRHAVLGGSDVALLSPQLVLLARQPQPVAGN